MLKSVHYVPRGLDGTYLDGQPTYLTAAMPAKELSLLLCSSGEIAWHNRDSLV